jgi:predicted dienelactone hydrolase
LFEGVAVFEKASLAAGAYPLVVLSHGSGGNAANLGWLAAALAADGFIVVAPNHPGTTSGDSRQADTLKIWNRPMDLSQVLTHVLADADLAGHIDKKHMSLAGFSMGGYAVLAAAGVKVNAEAFARYCDANQDPASDCAWYKRGGVDFHNLDAAHFDQSNLDARFTAVIAIDPALVDAFVSDSLFQLHVPALLINLGNPGKIPHGVDASEVTGQMPNAQYHTVTGATHFSFLGLCKADGKEILAKAGEDEPLCGDGGRSRADIHDEIVGQVLGFLKSKLTN